MPGDIKVISKPVLTQVTPTKNNLNDSKKVEAIKLQLKYIVLFESFIGINRLYLIYHLRIIHWLNYLFSLLPISAIIFCLIKSKSGQAASDTVIQDASSAEYICIVLISMLSKHGLKKFFEDLALFDDIMNLNDGLHITTPSNRGKVWITVCILYCMIEFISLWIYLPELVDTEFTVSYITFFAHDFEQLLFGTLLRMILMRVYVLKAHVEKMFLNDTKHAKKKLTKLEELSKKAQLDVSSLHRRYELLHKCSEQLNSLMSLPMMIILFCSGLSTTLLLRYIYKTMQRTDLSEIATMGIIAYAVIRCIRYTLLMGLPCYLSSLTTSQVVYMQKILHNAMNQANIGKVERRKIKAFFQLSRENEFAYALWGIIRLNMSLPLNYLSLCTTYLVIIIQFSKFLD